MDKGWSRYSGEAADRWIGTEAVEFEFEGPVQQVHDPHSKRHQGRGAIADVISFRSRTGGEGSRATCSFTSMVLCCQRSVPEALQTLWQGCTLYLSAMSLIRTALLSVAALTFIAFVQFPNHWNDQQMKINRNWHRPVIWPC